ncbi:polymer-forming cytoskeletal protein [uncultured Desulfovibrio sp.]|uniref:Polymer-forming cytoskeletal protein n=1 Tax=Candidatus Desulfovibrio intestinavium TaxID=2838534 RepID=A0A9D2KQA8_9BACT|nr:polymer-forming cytoskeletal protein [uncultured Desulfovibrio sp.]HJA79587.1 polymer-forming cytoskeletal protein [Candidatus Desulfovibrio intestinavium]
MGKDEINAFLGAGTVYEGKLTFQGAVRIDGIFSGEITSDGTLIVGKDAQISGTFQVGELMLSGNLRGDVTTKRRAVVHGSGVLDGTLHTPCLLTEEGGIIDGQIVMKKGSPEKNGN